MPKFTVPDYVSDPPVDSLHCDRDIVARRWLKDLGLDERDPKQWTAWPPSPVGELATRLGTSAEHVGAILQEAARQHQLKRMLAEVFDPIPHEIEARQQFIRLVEKTNSLPSRSGCKVWVHASRAEDSIDYLQRELADYPQLIEEWNNWAATWTALVARNPPLELRHRMGHVFDGDDFCSWHIGRERLFYDWLARGTREPMPFSDLHHILDDAYYKRLCELRDLSNGWFYSNEDVGRIVFVSLAEWEAISANWPRVLDQVSANRRIHKGP
jgi:hypothetical protein